MALVVVVVIEQREQRRMDVLENWRSIKVYLFDLGEIERERERETKVKQSIDRKTLGPV